MDGTAGQHSQVRVAVTVEVAGHEGPGSTDRPVRVVAGECPVAVARQNVHEAVFVHRDEVELAVAVYISRRDANHRVTIDSVEGAVARPAKPSRASQLDCSPQPSVRTTGAPVEVHKGKVKRA